MGLKLFACRSICNSSFPARLHPCFLQWLLPALSHLPGMLLRTRMSLGQNWACSCRKGPSFPFLVLESPTVSYSSRRPQKSTAAKEDPAAGSTHKPISHPSSDNRTIAAYARRRQGLTCYQRLCLLSTLEGWKYLKITLSSSAMIIRHPLLSVIKREIVLYLGICT